MGELGQEAGAGGQVFKPETASKNDVALYVQRDFGLRVRMNKGEGDQRPSMELLGQPEDFRRFVRLVCENSGIVCRGGRFDIGADDLRAIGRRTPALLAREIHVHRMDQWYGYPCLPKYELIRRRDEEAGNYSLEIRPPAEAGLPPEDLETSLWVLPRLALIITK